MQPKPLLSWLKAIIPLILTLVTWRKGLPFTSLSIVSAHTEQKYPCEEPTVLAFGFLAVLLAVFLTMALGWVAWGVLKRTDQFVTHIMIKIFLCCMWRLDLPCTFTTCNIPTVVGTEALKVHTCSGKAWWCNLERLSVPFPGELLLGKTSHTISDLVVCKVHLPITSSKKRSEKILISFNLLQK